MGVQPFLVASSLVGVLAQRLVRVLCPACKQAYRPTAEELSQASITPQILKEAGNPAVLYRSVGCAACQHTGYLGRTGIYELVTIDDELRTMIHDGAGEQQLERYARTRSPSIRDDGLRKALAGVTTLEEVLRVTRSD